MVRVCSNCTAIDIDQLEKLIPGELEVECIGECGQHEGKFFGYIDDELVITDTEEEFFEEVKVHIRR
ncbi:MAG: hypothetical protein K0R78_746 [Pelosinus sp.]|jgi:uncharacterized protein YuzB (UPF0349 family)|nr:hypothetical protein [Pelosinus sp.]